MTNIFKGKKVLICVGSGGVGKTTLSASLGVLAAQEGLRVLVMTIDPSLRLKTALGLGEVTDEIRLVPNQNYPGSIYVSLLNPEKAFNSFIQSAAAAPDMASQLKTNRLYQQLSTTLSGSQEFTSLIKLEQAVNSGEYDLVILDTPPAQHAIEFLEAPEKIYALFQDQVVRWFIGDVSKDGFIRKIISRGTRTVLQALEKITGAHFMTELSAFFMSVRQVQEGVSRKTQEVRNILSSSNTGFLLVTGFDEVKLFEAEELRMYLSKKNYQMSGLILNRAFPAWTDHGVHHEKVALESRVSEVYAEWSEYHMARTKIFDEFCSKWGQGLPVYQIPDFNMEVSGLSGLEVISNELKNRMS